MQYLPEIVLTEVGMTLLIIWIIQYCNKRLDTFSLRNVAVSSFILTMMAGMFNALAYYLLYPSGFLGTVVAVNIAMLEMTVLIVILLLLDDDIRGFTGKMALSFSFLFVFNEASMAIFLYYLGNYTGISSGILSPITGIGLGLNSYLLIIPMALEMAFLILVNRPVKYYQFILISILAVSITNPIILGNNSYIGIGVLVNFVAMILFMILLILVSLKEKIIENGKIVNLLTLFTLFMFSSISLFFGVLVIHENYAWVPYGIVGMLEMIFYFYLELSGHIRNDGAPVEVSTERIFELLSIVFISGLFSSLSIIEYFYPSVLLHF